MQPHCDRLTFYQWRSPEIPSNRKSHGRWGRSEKLQASQTSFNLVPYLTKGANKVEIVGEYRPVSSNVAIKLSGYRTQISQQVSGNGKLRQTLIITVR